MSARCAAEMCQYWTGQGCACDVLGIDRPDPDEGDEGERACDMCGNPFLDHEFVERCADCEADPEL